MSLNGPIVFCRAQMECEFHTRMILDLFFGLAYYNIKQSEG